jgi:glycosyltransferase involved in cell wall biosynthesis
VRISILTPDVSLNCLGRAYLLARVLQRRYEVEIVGPAFQDRVWEPLAGQDEVKLRIVPGYPLFHRSISQMRAIRSATTGDILYASKPLLTSYGAVLLGQFSDKRPLVLDIDDWQMGFEKEIMRALPLPRRLMRLAFSTLRLTAPYSYWNNLLGERLIGLADQVTVSNSFLKDRFGGTIVWHGRDTNAWDPRKFDRNHLRNEFGIPEDRKAVMFFGTPMPYKGIEDLIDAISLLKDNCILFMLVGLGEDSYSGRVEALVRGKLNERQARLFGLQPFNKVPEFLAISDLVVIPQRRNLATIGQIPAKVFDAMAMAKPTIATRVSDLPQILGGCGWIVDPENPDELARAIRYVFDHPDEAEEMGWNAREKCIEEYSWDAMKSILLGIFRRYE